MSTVEVVKSPSDEREYRHLTLENKIEVLLRKKGAGDASPHLLTGEKKLCTNLGSYNYLGFGGLNTHCTPLVVQSVLDFPITSGSCSDPSCCSELRLPLDSGATPACLSTAAASSALQSPAATTPPTAAAAAAASSRLASAPAAGPSPCARRRATRAGDPCAGPTRDPSEPPRPGRSGEAPRRCAACRARRGASGRRPPDAQKASCARRGRAHEGGRGAHEGAAARVPRGRAPG